MTKSLKLFLFFVFSAGLFCGAADGLLLKQRGDQEFQDGFYERARQSWKQALSNTSAEAKTPLLMQLASLQ